MEHGLLNQDALWVLDEVQLMDVGLATSAQLQTYRSAHSGQRPSVSWWMSATLQREWLETVDSRAMVSGLGLTQIPPAERTGPLWDDVEKPCRLEVTKTESWGELIADRALNEGAGKLTLVVVNTVDAACKLFAELQARFGATVARTGKKTKAAAESSGPELRLVHSRFRPYERSRWREDFLRRDASIPAHGRYCCDSGRRGRRRPRCFAAHHRAGTLAEPGTAIWTCGARRRARACVGPRPRSEGRQGSIALLARRTPGGARRAQSTRRCVTGFA